MAKRTRKQILEDKLKALEKKREYRKDRYVIPVDIEIMEVQDKLEAYNCKK